MSPLTTSVSFITSLRNKCEYECISPAQLVFGQWSAIVFIYFQALLRFTVPILFLPVVMISLITFKNIFYIYFFCLVLSYECGAQEINLVLYIYRSVMLRVYILFFD